MPQIDHKVVGHPIVGSKSVILVILEDIWGIISNPGFASVYKLIGDTELFFLIPFVGGFLRMEAYHQYMQDKNTYDFAEVNDQFIYNESM